MNALVIRRVKNGYLVHTEIAPNLVIPDTDTHVFNTMKDMEEFLEKYFGDGGYHGDGGHYNENS
jgi:hypothetical protein